jgi:hypothetical protein
MNVMNFADNKFPDCSLWRSQQKSTEKKYSCMGKKNIFLQTELTTALTYDIDGNFSPSDL